MFGDIGSVFRQLMTDPVGKIGAAFSSLSVSRAQLVGLVLCAVFALIMALGVAMGTQSFFGGFASLGVFEQSAITRFFQSALQYLVMAAAMIGISFGIRKLSGSQHSVAHDAFIVGVAVTASRGDIQVLMGFRFAAGDLLMILACVLYAGYTVAIRNRPAVPGLVFFTAVACVACLFSLPLLIGEIALGQFYLPTAKGWAILAFTVIGPSLLSQLFFMRAIEIIGPGRAGVFVNLVPVFAPILAVAILGEQLALYHGLALALVLGGIWIAERLGR